MCEISIIIPIKNRANTIGKCLESIHAQTNNNYEIIVVDDFSDDNTIEIVNGYKNKDKRIKLIDRKNTNYNFPPGVSSARNIGIEQAKGKYIQFVDSDDWIENDTIEILLNNISSEIDMIVFGANICDTNALLSEKVYKFTVEYYNSLYIGDFPVSDDTLTDMCTSSCNKLFRKDIIDNYNIRFPQIEALEDIDFIYKYLAHCNLIRYIPNKLYNYLQNNNSIMDKIRQKRIGHNFLNLKIFENIIDYYIEQGIQDKYKIFLSNLQKKSFYDDKYFFVTNIFEYLKLYLKAKELSKKYNLSIKYH